MSSRLTLAGCLVAAIGCFGLCPAPAAGQQPAPLPAYAPDSLTAADYTRAARYLRQNTADLVLHGAVRPEWLPDGSFWYRSRITGGFEFVLVDPARRTRRRLFDQPRLAAALAAASGTAVDSLDLPAAGLELRQGGRAVRLQVAGHGYLCDAAGSGCQPEGAAADSARLAALAGPNEVLSPDGRQAAFLRDHNLWVRELATGRETQLTTDGVQDYGYATDNAGWTRSDRPVLLWSPDSRKIATFQQDERAAGMMYLVRTQVGHPELEAWRYPLPGDSAIFTIARVVIDVAPLPRVVRLKLPPDPHRSSFCDDVACSGGVFSDVEWYADGSHVAFVSSSRDHKRAVLRVADATTGDVRDVLTETVATQYESGHDQANWRVLPASHEAIWFSERSDWGQLYLYDLDTGRLKHAITTGTGAVLEVLRVDPKSRIVFFTATGREPGRDPYFRHLYRVGLDGRGLELLTPENADHAVTLSPDGRWFVDSYSRPDVPPVTVLRDARGRLRLTLERADIAPLLATGWTPPIPFTVKARDGRTDLYGLMFRPTDFDSTRSYPIVDNVYPGPQTGSVGTRSFVPSRGDTRALAELGFVVVQLDALGTPLRSKSFHDAWYGDMGDNGLPDQLAALKQLAARYPWIDLGRAGIYGHSGGGYATADAMLRFPGFFRVGVAEAGNHDNREYEDDWGERYQGLLVRHPDGTTNYDNQANQLLADSLRGKLLIAYGTTDDNVPPYNSLLLIDALIRANRDFDVLPLPDRRHGFGAEPYMVRRRWDYFVSNLLGARPPHEYELAARRRDRP